MPQKMDKQAYLEGLHQRATRNRETVIAVFRPLDESRRSWQPAPGEWSVDQCFEHLKRALDRFLPSTAKARRTVAASADGVFRPGWLARTFFATMFDPGSKLPTIKAFNSSVVSHPGVIESHLAHMDTLLEMVEQAAQVDLRTTCWLTVGVPVPYSYGDCLNYFISHDELHIGQAQRVLEAYALHHSQTAALEDIALPLEVDEKSANIAG